MPQALLRPGAPATSIACSIFVRNCELSIAPGPPPPPPAAAFSRICFRTDSIKSWAALLSEESWGRGAFCVGAQDQGGMGARVRAACAR
jgi:hypothetical protein